MIQAAEMILAGPDRVHCIPFPNNEFAFPANISPRSCLFNQAAGFLHACRKCATGRKVKASHPEIVVTTTPLKCGNPWVNRQPSKSYENHD